MMYFRLFDDKKDYRHKKGLIWTREVELEEYNKLGYGIFWTVNLFKSNKRTIANLYQILRWAVDIDNGSKEEQLLKIKKGLIPSLVVETKRGFQVYFNAINGSLENWKAIVWHRLVPFYGADNNAKDVTRVLRAPGYFHKKNPNEPFLCRVVFQSDCVYSESDMLRFYKGPDLKKENQKQKNDFIHTFGNNLWEKFSNINCMDALARLSGAEVVNFEKFSFKENSNGNFNILVNGESTSCFIDKKGLIGSMDNGGPTIFQWINWYHKDKKKTLQAVKQIFPEILSK